MKYIGGVKVRMKSINVGYAKNKKSFLKKTLSQVAYLFFFNALGETIRAMHLSGGRHHASKNQASGLCFVNDAVRRGGGSICYPFFCSVNIILSGNLHWEIGGTFWSRAIPRHGCPSW